MFYLPIPNRRYYFVSLMKIFEAENCHVPEGNSFPQSRETLMYSLDFYIFSLQETNANIEIDSYSSSIVFQKELLFIYDNNNFSTIENIILVKGRVNSSIYFQFIKIISRNYFIPK